MADDVILNKAAGIERCLLRIVEEYGGDRQNLFANQTKQDAIILNLQRACETSIDLGPSGAGVSRIRPAISPNH